MTLTPTKLELPSIFKLIPLQVPDEYYRDGQINWQNCDVVIWKVFKSKIKKHKLYIDWHIFSITFIGCNNI